MLLLSLVDLVGRWDVVCGRGVYKSAYDGIKSLAVFETSPPCGLFSSRPFSEIPQSRVKQNYG